MSSAKKRTLYHICEISCRVDKRTFEIKGAGTSLQELLQAIDDNQSVYVSSNSSHQQNVGIHIEDLDKNDTLSKIKTLFNEMHNCGVDQCRVNSFRVQPSHTKDFTWEWTICSGLLKAKEMNV